MASFAIVLRLLVCLPVLRRGIDCVATTAAAVPAHEPCTVSTVTEGELAVMTFMLGSGIDTTSKTFFAHLRRKDRKLTDIITCNGRKVSCNVKDGYPMFQVEGNIKENILKVRISNMSRELEDTYVLQVYFNGTTETSSSCALTMDTIVNATLVTDTDDENGSYGWIAAPILVLIVSAILFFFCRKNLQHCWSLHVANTDQTPKPNERSADPLLSNNQPLPCSQDNVDHPSTRHNNRSSPHQVTHSADEMDTLMSHAYRLCNNDNPSPQEDKAVQKDMKGKPWYFHNITREEADELLLGANNGNDTFLISDADITIPLKEIEDTRSSLTLIVNFDGAILYFPIKRTDTGGVQLLGGDTPFNNVSELVAHYKTCTIKRFGVLFRTIGEPARESNNE